MFVTKQINVTIPEAKFHYRFKRDPSIDERFLWHLYITAPGLDDVLWNSYMDREIAEADAKDVIAKMAKEHARKAVEDGLGRLT